MGQRSCSIPLATGEEVIIPRIRKRLERGVKKTLMLIIGPSGLGKTTQTALLARAVVNHPSWCAVWIVVASSDNSFQVFWSHVVNALETLSDGEICPDLETMGDLSGDLSQSDRDAWIDALAEQVNGGSLHVMCVIDGVDLVQEGSVINSLERLMAQAAPYLHLVMLGKSNPGISLFRLRLDDQVEEISSCDLAFTEQETDIFFKEQHRPLLPADVRAVYRLTLGWVAALRMIILSMKIGTGGFCLDDFQKNSHWVNDFLRKEVLSCLSDEAIRLMLRTCLFDFVNRNMMEAVLGQDRRERIIDELRAANVLVVANRSKVVQDNEWLTYHPLFVESLRHMMYAELSSVEIKHIALSAVDWYESEGCYELAIRTALAQGEYVRTFDLVTNHLYSILSYADSSVFLQWLKKLPHPQRENEQLYFLVNAWANFIAGKTKRAQMWLNQIEVSESRADICTYKGANSVYKTIKVGSMVFSGEYKQAIELGASLLDNLGGPQLFLRCTIMHNMGEALSRLGRYREAYEYYVRARVNAEISGRRTIELLCACEISWLQYAEGRLDTSSNTVMRALASCSDEEMHTAWPVGLLQVAMARVYVCWGEVDKALDYLESAFKLLGPKVNRDGFLEARIVLAKCKKYKGETEDAFDLLIGAYEMLKLDKVPRGVNLLVLTSLAACLAEMGQTDRALSVLEEARLQTCIEDVFYCVLEDCVQAHAEAVEGDHEHALLLFDKARKNSEEAGLTLLEQDCMVFCASMLRACDRKDEAQSLVAEALQAASKEGHVYPFKRDVPFLESLVYEIAYPSSSNLILSGHRMRARQFAQSMLEGDECRFIGIKERDDEEDDCKKGGLTQREQQIYKLLKQGKTRKQIADTLGIRSNTVRTHIRNIYQKTGIHERSLL